MRVVILCVLFASLASAALVAPDTTCPSNDNKWLMHFAGIGAQPGYLADVMFYNRAPNELEYGSPLGPFFNFQEGPDCYFSYPNSLHCGLNLYSDSGYSIKIGTGQIDSDVMIANVSADGNTYLGGWLTLSTNITNPASGSDISQVNFRSQSGVRIWFQPERTWPAPSTGKPAGTNVLDWQNKTITLWGSDGWDGSTYDENVRHTGFDFRVSLTCPSQPTQAPTPPPNGVPTPCLNCRTIFSAATSCGGLISYRTSGNCASLSFDSTLSSSQSGACGNESA